MKVILKKIVDIIHDLWLDILFTISASDEYSPEKMPRRFFDE
jgi:hypothetical protein